MKSKVFVFGITVASLAFMGCNKPDPRVAKLEARVDILESNLDELKEEQSNSIQIVQTGLSQMQTLTSNDVGNYEQLLEVLKSNVAATPNSSLPGTASGANTAIDPGTATPSNYVPDDPSPKILRSANKVTESNDVWWRWSYSFTVGNPGFEKVHFDAHIKFYDQEGFMVQDKDEYQDIGPLSTNAFTGSALIDVPVAQKIRKFSVTLEK